MPFNFEDINICQDFLEGYLDTGTVIAFGNRKLSVEGHGGRESLHFVFLYTS